MSRPRCDERQGGHEDDEQHEQHVDHRRDVHVRVGLRVLALEDRFGAEVLVGWPLLASPAAGEPLRRGSVMRPMSSMPLARSSSIASITALYSTSSSALMMTMRSFLSSRISSTRRRRSSLRHRHGVDEEPLVRSRSRRPSGPASRASRCVLAATRQLDADALLQQRRHDHHDDEQHQHDVDERRDVDVGLDSAFGAAHIPLP